MTARRETDSFVLATSELVVATKSGKRWFDLDAVREPHKVPEAVYNARPATQNIGAPGHHTDPDNPADGMRSNPAGAPPLDWWLFPDDGPTELRVRVIKSMCPFRVCRVCGEPSRRIVETERLMDGVPYDGPKGRPLAGVVGSVSGGGGENVTQHGSYGVQNTTVGWSDCGHDDFRAGITLDPFQGVLLEREENQMSSRYIIGDTREVLATLESNSVDLIISSPPFLALRSYLPADHPDKAAEIGSEATPAAFLDVLLDIVEECARVLAPHGSLCFELGDTYSGSGGAGGDYAEDGWHEGQNGFRQIGGNGWPDPKSLCMIPQSFAWALSYGRNPFNGRETPRWKVRNIVRWCRPNPPVGALGDKFRPATSEMVVACKAQNRWFDLDAVRDTPRSDHAAGERTESQKRGSPEDHLGGGQRRADARAFKGLPNFDERVLHPAGAPPLDWWEIPTQPYKGSHYATWPEKLLVKPILSMCPERVCRTCGEPSRRIVETTLLMDGKPQPPGRSQQKSRASKGGDYEGPFPGTLGTHHETLGWSDCGHNDWRRGIVLDVFGGTGTTAAVAEGHGRDSILIDIDRRNAELAAERVGMFLSVEEPNREGVA